MREKGFTLLELAVAGFFLTIIVGAAAVAISGDQTATRVITAPVAPELRANAVLERIASELRMAGEWGEDLDRDGELDEGEDTNGNGALDSDWTLADGATNQTTLSFNRRIDETDPDGNVTATGIYSRRVTYMLEGERFIREWTRTLPGGVVQTNRTVLARGIGALRFSRTGRLVTVEVDVLLPPGMYADDERTVRTQVWLRN